MTSNQSYNTNYKQFWLNTKLVPNSKPDTQLPFLIETLKKQLDITKIQTVLEVGVGYGRVAKAILDAFPIVDLYDGFDISEHALEQSDIYLKEYVIRNVVPHTGYCYMIGDFEDYPISELYDLVISVETMSCVPESHKIQPWIDKMCKLSKKYVVNLDYVKTTHPIFNNRHDYIGAYGNISGNNWIWLGTPNADEKLFICRVK